MFDNTRFDYIIPFEHSDHANYVIQLDRRFAKAGKSFLPVVDSETLAGELKTKNFTRFLNSAKYCNEFELNGLDLVEEVGRLTKVFDFPQVRRMLFPESFYLREPEEKFYKKLVKQLRFFEENFLKRNVTSKFFVQYVGDLIPYYSRKVAARKFSEKVLCCGGYMIFDRMNFTFDFQGRWKIDDDEIQPTADEIAAIRTWIAKTLERRRISVPLPLDEYRPKLQNKIFLKTMLLPGKMLKIIQSNKPGSSVASRFKREIQPVFTRKKVEKLYARLDLTKHAYIYFPLHFIYDSALTSMAEPFVDQFYLIELIHRFLPFGYKLVVKEHPAAMGATPYAALRRLSKLKDVMLVPVHQHSQDIINNARAVAVISSSVGFEALFQRKPVLTFADNFYTGQDVTIDVRNLHELPDKILECLQFTPDEELLMKMFARAYRDSYPINQAELSQSVLNGDVASKYEQAAPHFVKSIVDFCQRNEKEITYSVELPYSPEKSCVEFV